MTNNFNAEQARKNAKDVKIDQALIVRKNFIWNRGNLERR